MKTLCDVTYEVIQEIRSEDGRGVSSKISLGTFETREEALGCYNSVKQDPWARCFIDTHYKMAGLIGTIQSY